MKENEIRPEILFAKYIELGKKDIEIFFTNVELLPINCPACGEIGNFVFNKFRFNYEECNACKTLYVSPRPKKEAFDKYYSDSDSSEFWANEFYKETEVKRREKIWKPKAALVSKKIDIIKDVKCLVDIGGGYGTFVEELKKINKGIDILIIEPSQRLAQICIEKKLTVICDFFENVNTMDLPNLKTVYTSFELFEHLHNPELFLQNLYNSMKKDDIFLFTTLNGMGVDIQVLWKNSKSVSPPHHLNFFNPKSIRKLLKHIGFDILEVTTPGKLDIDIMCNNINDVHDRFWNNFLNNSSDIEKENMQKIISDNLLSSHMMIMCGK